MRSLLLLCIFVLVIGLGSCTPDESLPPARTSSGAVMDGSHEVPLSGVPDVFKQTSPIDQSAAPEGFSTTPIALFAPYSYAVGSRNGRIFLFNDNDSLSGTIDLGSPEMIEQLLTDSLGLYAITANGDIYAYSQTGKQLWKGSAGGMLTGSAIIAEDQILIPRGDQIVSLASRNGAARWQRTCPVHVISVAYNALEHYLAVALSNYEAGQTDSIAILDLSGKQRSAVALTGARITSNIAICGEKKDAIAVGVMTLNSGRKPASVVTYEDIASGQPKLRWSHTVPYLVMNVASNNDQVFTSGFRTVENELVSGINAFSLNDSTSMWARRFTEPVASPIAVSKGNVYFTLSFTSEAIVATRGLFYALRAGTGKTETERALKGANAFVPGMPIPDEQGRLLIADRDRLIVHIIDRSSLKRVF